jgi:hypothetical protein
MVILSFVTARATAVTVVERGHVKMRPRCILTVGVTAAVAAFWSMAALHAAPLACPSLPYIKEAKQRLAMQLKVLDDYEKAGGHHQVVAEVHSDTSDDVTKLVVLTDDQYNIVGLRTVLFPGKKHKDADEPVDPKRDLKRDKIDGCWTFDDITSTSDTLSEDEKDNKETPKGIVLYKTYSIGRAFRILFLRGLRLSADRGGKVDMTFLRNFLTSKPEKFGVKTLELIRNANEWLLYADNKSFTKIMFRQNTSKLIPCGVKDPEFD